MKQFFTTLISLLLLLSFFLWPKIIKADIPPTLISPANTTTVSSSKVTWQTPEYQLAATDKYRVQIDNQSDFSSPEKDYTTNNTSYTPSLAEGIWHWRVKAKDSTNQWSDWSSVWNFTYSLAPTPSPTPTPQPSATITPSPTPVSSTPEPSNTPDPSPLETPTPLPSVNPTATPTPTIAASSTPLPTPTSSPKSTLSFSQPPTIINSNQPFLISVTFLNFTPNQKYFLKGAFKKGSSSNYFGKTLVSEQWINNSETALKQLPIQLDTSGNWTGNLEVSPDAEDSGFTGTGEYIFKIGYYNSSGENLTWSTEKTISIVAVASPTSTPTNSTTPVSTPTPTTTPIALSLNLNSTSSPSGIVKELKPVFSDPLIEASVAGIQTENISTFKELPLTNNFNWSVLVGFLQLALAGGVAIYSKQEQIKSWLQTQIPQLKLNNWPSS